MQLTRAYIKHKAEPTTFAIEYDEEGTILAALDVTADATSGGLCPHLLTTLPLAGHIDDVAYLQRSRDDLFIDYDPDCGNTHHLLADLLALERDHRAAATAYATAASRATSLKKDMERAGAAVHELLEQIRDRKPLPLFAAAGL